MLPNIGRDKMTKTKMLEWEAIDDNIVRARIFGGWLVRIVNDVYTLRGNDQWDSASTGYEFRESITFVPDIQGYWILEEAK
jgi:hypothetical protein